MEYKNIRKAVRERYTKIAKQEDPRCTPVDSCCGNASLSHKISCKIGYTDKEMKAVPERSNLGLGCGNPVALASLRKGDTVLDLGSGAGFDCFLASQKVGKEGKVIGVDMTPEMIEKARENAVKNGYMNVEFRLGEIEHLPVADSSFDVVISNCVINLSPDKDQVFGEVFRVLKPGGILMISDIVLLKDLPDFIKRSVDAYVGCLSGAIMKNKYLKLIENTGFQDVDVINESSFPIDCMINDPNIKTLIETIKIPTEKLNDIGSSVISITIRGVKPS